MAMFGRFEDWGLQAVVGASSKIEKMENLQEQCSLGIRGMPQDDQDFLLGFSDLFAKSSSSTIRWGDGLESLYKPFYPVKYSTSTELPNPGPPKEVKNEEEVQPKQGPNQEVILDQSSSSVLAVSYSPRFKKRKNQQKRVITQVKAEDYLTSDMWAWRKYGQKPIKGSPYPRSYYRCSSMKGCQARKQVEQSCTDPEVYVVTYTEEHCHSQPTRRNSLAGTVRNKFPVIPKSPTARGNNSLPLASNQEIISSSKTPPLNECTEEELSEKNLKQQKILDEELRTVEWGLNNNNCDPFLIPDFLMPDDFFSGLGDLDGPEL